MSESNVLAFDHVLVGSGQATATLVGGLPSDASIAVIEAGALGGTCVNTGCTPTKALVASARAARQARRAAQYGVRTGEVAIDFGRVMERMNDIRHGNRDGLEQFLAARPNVTLIRGFARFEDPKTLRVGEQRITGRRIYLNVGTRSRAPGIPGLDDVAWLDNAGLLEVDALPEHLIVIGGSYVGLEFAQAFARFGSRVTVIETADRIMAREDDDVSDAARAVFENEGIHIVTGAEGLSLAPAGAGVEVTLTASENTFSLRGSHLLVATGRVPNSDGLNLEVAGIATDERGYIQVDDQLRTTAEGVFAVGDVNGRGAFAHTSVNDAEIVLDALRGGSRRLSDRITVYAMFADPSLGRVGLSEKEALANGHRVLKATKPMASVGRAREMGETQGFVKLLVDADSEQFLGASVFGMGGDEIINMFAVFMTTGLPYHRFREAVLVHPTVSEAMPLLLDGLEPVTPAVAPPAEPVAVGDHRQRRPRGVHGRVAPRPVAALLGALATHSRAFLRHPGRPRTPHRAGLGPAERTHAARRRRAP